MSRLSLFIPLGLFLLLSALLFKGFDLQDPSILPSALIDQEFPAFSLATVKNVEQKRSVEDLKGEVSLVNVWATWCPPCRAEHGELIRLSQQENIALYGVNYKDGRKEALRWLAQLGDPYRWTVVDLDGQLGLDLGVTGAPESFIVDAQGNVVYKYVGVLTEKVWRERLQPVVQKLQGG